MSDSDNPVGTQGRRRFIQTGASVAVGAAVTGCKESENDDSSAMEDEKPTLRITMWKHFVPSYDQWIDQIAAQWGEDNDVDVQIEHVELDQVNPLLNDAIAAGEGPDIFEAHFPTAYLEGTVVDLADVASEAESLYGAQVELARRQCQNPNTGVYHSLTHGYYVFGGLYRKSLWEAAGFPDGPASFEDLATGGEAIRMATGELVGIGMANELDSNHALRAVMWGHGASVQDENENVVLDSPETRAALDYMADLYARAMDAGVEDIFNWSSRDNNASLNEGRASYVVNPISAYRTGQRNAPDIADDTFLLPPLAGPGGARSGTVILSYVVPGYTEESGNAQLAKDFILHLLENAESDVFESELYNLPAFPGAAPQLYEPGTGWLAMDPFGSMPADKLDILRDSEAWGANIGYPGPANAAVAEIFDQHIIPDMFKGFIQGGMSADDAIAQAMAAIEPIFQKWRDAGLIG